MKFLSQRLKQPLKQLLALLAAALFCVGCSDVPSLSTNPWQAIPLPSQENMNDITFAADGQIGWLVGGKGTVMKTADGGDRWELVDIGLDPEEKLQLTSVSFSGEEGWIVGRPSALLHSRDRGETWERVPLSEKLPGEPSTIFATGSDAAEMTTSVGAIYRTENDGENWKAMVEEAVGVLRNISRSPDGSYVAVSARGNFFSTWQPGDERWSPHNRNSSRRLQKMGFGKDGRLWMLARGGQVQFSEIGDAEAWNEEQFPGLATSWGLLDLDYRTPTEIWVVGGSGQMLASFDGGKTWLKDREVEDVPANLYKIKFFSDRLGFAIGQRGNLLRYQDEKASATEKTIS